MQTMTIGIAGYRCLQEKLSLTDTLELVRSAGAETYEPLGITTDEERDALGAGLEKYGLKMPSVYVNSRLHEDGWEEAITGVLEQACQARSLGASILVTNPQPIAWGQPLDKTDAQLETQRQALIFLGRALQTEGMALAYHVHDVELRHDAHELHAMLGGVPAPLMGFCLDAHWLYRGSGNSAATMTALVAQYATRVISVHVRQSEGGVCAETLDGSDMDGAAIAATVKAAGFDGPVYVELLQEPATPRTRSLLQAHTESLATLREWFL
jgi:inosose dehydratase